MKTIKKFLVISILIITTLLSIRTSSSVFATGGADDGTSPSGGSCHAGTNWAWDTCYGYSWQKYKVLKDLPSGNGVHFHYTPETGGSVPLHYCKKGQTLYNYGFEVYGANDNYSYNGHSYAIYGTQVSTQSNKNGTQAKWRSKGARGAFTKPRCTNNVCNNNTTGNYLQVVGYADASNAKKQYEKMLAYDKEHKTNYTHGTKWSDVGYFCFDDGVNNVTLTVKYVDESNKSIGHADGKVTVQKGSKAEYKVEAVSGYEYKGYGTSYNGSLTNSTTVTVNPLNANATRYAVFRKISTFQSKSTASGSGASADTGWTQEKTVNTYTDNSCSPLTGCNVTINHSLKRTAGDGSTTYKITRSSNLTTSDDMNKGINDGIIVKSGTVFNKSSGEVLRTTHKLYPGMYICEIINFKPNDKSGTTETAYSKVCVGAKGNAQPNDPDPPQPEGTPNSGNSAFLSTRVKNTKVTKYNKYLATVYAKPGDMVTYRTVYNPVLQYTYNLTPTHIQFSGGTKIKNDSTPKKLKLGPLFNAKKPSSLSEWNNAFKVERSTDNFSSSTPIGTINGVHQRNGGIYTIKTVTDEYNKNNNGIRQQDVGSAIKERSNTYTVPEVKTTPSQVSFNGSTGSDLSVANVYYSEKYSTATVNIPYNFVNKTTVEKKGDEPYLFAGETGTFDVTITVSPKENSLTTNNPANEKYSTIVRDAKWKIKLYNRESGEVYGETTPTKTQNTMGDVSIGDLNTSGQSPTNGQPAKDVDEHKSLTINIPDLPAGTWVCVQSSVYPENSGPENNLNKNGNDAWETSTKTAPDPCYKIAKKPSLQVWGGNIYSRGNIETNTSVKGNLAGYTDSSTWIKEGSSQSIDTFYTSKHIFGSWGELGIIASGGVTGLASGASTGYSENDNGNLWPSPYSTNPSTGNKNPGGSIEREPIDYCHRSRLSFANSNCSAGVAGSIGTVSSSEQNAKDKENVFNKYVDESKSETGSSVAEFKGNDYYYNKEDITIGNGTTLTVPEDSTEKNTPSIVYSTKNITISSNLEYGGDYEKLEQVPKLIIYAKQNIYIDCRVSRIDALLIADYNVVTCDNLGGEGTIEQKAKDKIDDQMNSNQLRINGAILASKVIANRTYGAATGANSIIPAEIINFDPTLYLWGGNPTIEYDESSEDSDEGSSSNLDVVDITELSPRY